MKTHAVRCPQCSAMLDVEDGTRLIRCRYCRTPCHLDWKGSQPAASPEAQEFARLLGEIDLDAVEKSLDDLNEYLDEQQGQRQDLTEAADRLSSDATLDALAVQVVRSDKAHEFMEGVSRLEVDETEEHEVKLREILSRVAVKMAVLDTGQTAPAATASKTADDLRSTGRRAGAQPKRTAPGLDEEQSATAQLIRNAKAWRWLPWVGLLLVPVLVVGLAVIATLVLAFALPKEAKGQWLTILLAAGLFASPVCGLAWFWYGLRRRKRLDHVVSQWPHS